MLRHGDGEKTGDGEDGAVQMRKWRKMPISMLACLPQGRGGADAIRCINMLNEEGEIRRSRHKLFQLCNSSIDIFLLLDQRLKTNSVNMECGRNTVNLLPNRSDV